VRERGTLHIVPSPVPRKWMGVSIPLVRISIATYTVFVKRIMHYCTIAFSEELHSIWPTR
jgi:hypothetical protein